VHDTTKTFTNSRTHALTHSLTHLPTPKRRRREEKDVDYSARLYLEDKETEGKREEEKKMGGDEMEL
jgi:hypothetical protein